MADVRGAVVIGSSDGIGLALVRRLLDDGWTVRGLSRRDAPVEHERYRHRVCDVRDPDFATELVATAGELERLDACIYCAGIGELLDPDDLGADVATFEVNLTGCVRAAAALIPPMIAAGHGHFVGLSSQADRFLDPSAPSYAASKAGMSSYLEGLALALRPRGVHVTNVRFGFVRTKMAKSPVTPFIIEPERAAALVVRCLRKKPIRFTYPRRMAMLLWLAKWPGRIRIWLS